MLFEFAKNNCLNNELDCIIGDELQTYFYFGLNGVQYEEMILEKCKREINAFKEPMTIREFLQ